MLNSFLNVVHEIGLERDFQRTKYESRPNYGGHSVAAWLFLIEAELQEAKMACIKGGEGRDHVLAEIVQVAALCCACLEQHGMNFQTPKRDV